MIAEGEAFPADAAARLGVKGKNAVVYFYGADGSPSCTKEAEAFDAANAELKKLGFDVVGVRPENQAKSAFAEKYSQRFVPDTDNEIRKQLDIKGDLFGLLAGRETYVIDKAGQVQMVFNSQFKPEQHVENALEAAAVVAQNGRQGSFLDNLKLFHLAVSLGSTESLAEHPYSMTHADVDDQDKIALGITESLVRLSIGVEHADDLIWDIEQALTHV